MTTDCPPEALAEALQTADADTERGLAAVGALIAAYGADARLHFLKGSLLASAQRYDEAHAAMGQAVILQPGYDLARFQLGLLELSSGRPEMADATLAPLEQGPPDEPLRLFAEGLRRLIRDDFAGAAAKLRAGIARGGDNAPLARDMQMLLAEAERGLAQQGGDGGDAAAGGRADGAPGAAPAETAEADVTSPAQQLLQQFGRKPPTRH